jgi:ribosome-binding ATPase YchF (GTP1/OBG family)
LGCEIEVLAPRLSCWQDYKEISMRLKEIPRGEERSAEQLIEHYELEKELAGKLKKSTKEERNFIKSFMMSCFKKFLIIRNLPEKRMQRNNVRQIPGNLILYRIFFFLTKPLWN